MNSMNFAPDFSTIDVKIQNTYKKTNKHSKVLLLMN